VDAFSGKWIGAVERDSMPVGITAGVSMQPKERQVLLRWLAVLWAFIQALPAPAQGPSSAHQPA